jgi:hypothetical protein
VGGDPHDAREALGIAVLTGWISDSFALDLRNVDKRPDTEDGLMMVDVAFDYRNCRRGAASLAIFQGQRATLKVCQATRNREPEASVGGAARDERLKQSIFDFGGKAWVAIEVTARRLSTLAVRTSTAGTMPGSHVTHRRASPA